MILGGVRGGQSIVGLKSHRLRCNKNLYNEYHAIEVKNCGYKGDVREAH